MILTDIPTDQLHPHPDNPRTELRDLDVLAASIAEVGILQPLVVQLDGDGYVIHMGHRRHAAAIQADLQQVPCLIADTEDQVQVIARMLNENLHRDPLTSSESAAGFAQLALLGLDEAGIARLTATPRATVRDALVLHQLPAAAHAAADNGDLDLEDAAALAELPDQVAAKILAKPHTQWGLRHEIQTARTAQARQTAIQDLTNDFLGSGVIVLEKKPADWPYGKVAPAHTLTDRDGNAVDPDQVRTTLGFAAVIECPQGSTEATATIACLDPEMYGYTRTGYTRYQSPQELAQEQAAEEAAATRRANLTAAAEIRWQFVLSTYGSAKAAKAAWLPALRAIVVNPHLNTPGRNERANALAGVPDRTDLQQAGVDRLTRLLVCRYLVAQEEALDSVTNGARWGRQPEIAVQWLDQLVAAGYTLSAAEADLYRELTEDEEEDLTDDEDDLVDENAGDQDGDPAGENDEIESDAAEQDESAEVVSQDEAGTESDAGVDQQAA